MAEACLPMTASKNLDLVLDVDVDVDLDTLPVRPPSDGWSWETGRGTRD